MLKKLKEYLKSLRMRFLAPVFIAINELKEQWDKSQVSINELKEVEVQQWNKLQVSINELKEIEIQLQASINRAFLDLQSRSSEIVQMNRGIEDRLGYLQHRADLTIGLQNDLALTLLNIVNPMLYTSTSILQNTAVPLTEICSTEKYRYIKELHELTEVKELKGAAKLVRIGRVHDGGYIMAEPISEGKIAYSAGISDEVSWDQDMAARGYQIFQYDHTIQALPVEDPNFHWKKVGLGGEDHGDIKTLKTILAKNGHLDAAGMVLKMDIEGSEWEVINSCSEDILERFDQIVLELHDLIIPSDKKAVLDALRLLSKTHFVVHIHGNNFRHADYCGDLITPNVLEITYVSRSKYQCEGKGNGFLPLGIDTPNNIYVPELWLGRW